MTALQAEETGRGQARIRDGQAAERGGTAAQDGGGKHGPDERSRVGQGYPVPGPHQDQLETSETHIGKEPRVSRQTAEEAQHLGGGGGRSSS